MLRRRYALIQRDHLSRGITIISFHWFKWRARVRAASLAAREARALEAFTGPPALAPQSSRYSWEVDTRCA